jgi:ketosteroid isomerase-like protein
MFAALPVLLTASCTPKDDTATGQPSGSSATSAVGAPKPGDTVAIRRFIDSAEARFVAAANRGDVEAIMADYGTDPILLRANRPLERGRHALRKEYTELYGRAQTKDAKVVTQAVLYGSDMAVETGTYEVTVLANGGERRDTGKYIFVWKRQLDGSWKGMLDADIPDTPSRQ